MKTSEFFDELKKENYEVLLDAVATFNADAFLIEDIETAEEVAKALLEDSANVMTVENTDGEEWMTSYEKLDFTASNQPERIISANGVLVCLASDYKPLDMEEFKESELLPETLYELAELINKSEDYPVNTVYRAIEFNGWVNTEAESDYDICSDGESRLVIDCNSGEAVVR